LRGDRTDQKHPKRVAREPSRSRAGPPSSSFFIDPRREPLASSARASHEDLRVVAESRRALTGAVDAGVGTPRSISSSPKRSVKTYRGPSYPLVEAAPQHASKSFAAWPRRRHF